MWLFAGWLAAGVALADVYTWVDPSGNLNVSNLTPPAGGRVARVTHESAEVIARAEALRKSAEEREMRALSARVAQLERAAEKACAAPPPASLPPEYDGPPAP